MAEDVSPGPCSAADGPPVRARAPTNAAIAAVLDEVARLLEAQGASRPRVRSYRRVASVVRRVQRSAVETLATKGVAGLAAMTKTSYGLTAAIAEIAATGQLALLDGLRGTIHPESLLVGEAGIGGRLARRVEETLGIVTHAELQVAAGDGRLGKVPGFGARRVRAVHRALTVRFGVRVRGRLTPASLFRVPLDEVLDVDRQYRACAVRGRLPCVVPPDGVARGFAWPPILHTARGERFYTALFAVTALAHALGKTNDWVVVYAENPHGRRQAMVVTETVGPHAGHRVVRGREHESRERLVARSFEPRPPEAEAADPREWRGSKSLRRRRDAPGVVGKRSDRAPRSRVPRGPRRSPAPSPGVA